MKTTRASAFLFGALLSSLAAAAGAQVPMISVDPTACLPAEDNGVITAKVSPEVGGTLVRLYFRWKDRGDNYFVPMVGKGGGRYWTVLPKPERRNEMVEYYGAVVNAEGKEISRSKVAMVTVKDRNDCKLPLTEKELGLAENLVIGETVQPQNRRSVLGFLCDGIVSRIDASGVLRADNLCRTCVVAFWQKRAVFGPLFTTTAIVTDEDPNPSPASP